MDTDARKTVVKAEEHTYSKTNLSVKSTFQLSKFYSRDEAVMTPEGDNNDESDCSATVMLGSNEDKYPLNDANTTYSEKHKNIEHQGGIKRAHDDGGRGMSSLYQ